MEVYQEVYVKGMQNSVNEVGELKALFNDGVVEVLTTEFGKKQTPANDLFKSSGLHAGEIAVLRAADSLGGTAVIDDKRARTVGEAIGLDLSGTVAIIIEFVRLKLISKPEAKESIDKMVNEGWYCSAKDYVQMIRSIDSVRVS
ncbi:MAG: DUF3368 domain-containing protein [Nitrososphaerales archaeon]